MIAAIVAMASNGVIGKQNDLPWYLPADLKRFKEITTGHTVIMGRKTADSIVARLGHGLPNRQNIVITRDDSYGHEDFVVAHSIQAALDLANGDAFILGGAQVFELAMPFIETLHITEVHAAIDGDVFFPDYNKQEWQEVAREQHKKDEKNQYDYDFVELQRVR